MEILCEKPQGIKDERKKNGRKNIETLRQRLWMKVFNYVGVNGELEGNQWKLPEENQFKWLGRGRGSKSSQRINYHIKVWNLRLDFIGGFCVLHLLRFSMKGRKGGKVERVTKGDSGWQRGLQISAMENYYINSPLMSFRWYNYAVAIIVSSSW